jgi:hypothetical protein
MKTRELTQSELEMLGLDNGTITTPTPVVNNIKPAVTLRRKASTTALQPYVGAFVVTADGLYGMIDDVHGESLGFVHAEKDTWTGELIDASKVKIVSPTTVDGAKAFRSAQVYFNREATSLRSRIARNYEFDDKVTLNNMLTHCETWLRKLDA